MNGWIGGTAECQLYIVAAVRPVTDTNLCLYMWLLQRRHKRADRHITYQENLPSASYSLLLIPQVAIVVHLCLLLHQNSNLRCLWSEYIAGKTTSGGGSHLWLVQHFLLVYICCGAQMRSDSSIYKT